MYNDFPILSDQAYLLMNQEFAKTRVYSRDIAINQIFFALCECKNLCYNVGSNYNKRVIDAVAHAKEDIDNCITNLQTAFELDELPQQEIKEFNIFSILKNLTNSIGLTFEVFTHEAKEYHKKIASSNLKLLTQACQTILTALESSQIKLFRFM